MRTWPKIIVHHSYSVDNDKTNDWNGIVRYLTSWRYNGRELTVDEAKKLISKGVHGVQPPDVAVAYNYGIEEVGGQLVVQTGRSTEIDGAHCRENRMNHDSLGICLIGNYNKTDDANERPGSGPPDEGRLSKLVGLIVKLHTDGLWVPSVGAAPESLVFGHREFAFSPYPPKEGQKPYKQCPGSAFDLDAFRSRVGQALRAAEPNAVAV